MTERQEQAVEALRAAAEEATAAGTQLRESEEHARRAGLAAALVAEIADVGDEESA
jgi:hypothetical protein